MVKAAAVRTTVGGSQLVSGVGAKATHSAMLSTWSGATKCSIRWPTIAACVSRRRSSNGRACWRNQCSRVGNRRFTVALYYLAPATTITLPVDCSSDCSGAPFAGFGRVSAHASLTTINHCRCGGTWQTAARFQDPRKPPGVWLNQIFDPCSPRLRPGCSTVRASLTKSNNAKGTPRPKNCCFRPGFSTTAC